MLHTTISRSASYRIALNMLVQVYESVCLVCVHVSHMYVCAAQCTNQ